VRAAPHAARYDVCSLAPTRNTKKVAEVCTNMSKQLIKQTQDIKTACKARRPLQTSSRATCLAHQISGAGIQRCWDVARDAKKGIQH